MVCILGWFGKLSRCCCGVSFFLSLIMWVLWLCWLLILVLWCGSISFIMFLRLCWVCCFVWWRLWINLRVC